MRKIAQLVSVLLVFIGVGSADSPNLLVPAILLILGFGIGYIAFSSASHDSDRSED